MQASHQAGHTRSGGKKRKNKRKTWYVCWPDGPAQRELSLPTLEEGGDWTGGQVWAFRFVISCKTAAAYPIQHRQRELSGVWPYGGGCVCAGSWVLGGSSWIWTHA